MQILPIDPKDRKYAILGIKIARDFGITLAVPVIFFVVLAEWLAEKYGLGLWITIAAFLLSGIISTIIIVRKAKEYGKQYQKIEEEFEDGNNKK